MASLQNTTINGTNNVIGALNANTGDLSQHLSFVIHDDGLRMFSGGQRGDNNIRIINGFTFKHLGGFTVRSQPVATQFFDARTNLSGDSIMFMFHVVGYLYNNGLICGWASGYTYNAVGPDAVIATFVQNIGQSTIVRTYRSGGKLCIKLSQLSSGYSEGRVDIYFHAFNSGTQNAAVVEAFALNNTSANHF